MSENLIFEIGTEEIPARFLPPAIEQLQSLAAEQFKTLALDYDEIKIYATPRRLTLKVVGLADKQADSIVEAKGPAFKAAYDADGQPTRALLGFCKSQGIEPADAATKEINGVKYIFVQKHISGTETVKVLPEVFKTLITKLYFPKPMRWGYGDFRFARPIHWLVAMYGKQVIPFEFEGVAASDTTKGHRVLGSDAIVLADADCYETALKENYVIVDQAVRREMIAEQIKQVAASIDGIAGEDEELFEEVTFILEYPTALVGNFDNKYLAIPKELVITPMREHQRYFPVYAKDGSLLPKFITVRNGDSYGLEVVAAGNEKVLRARLADAEFFYQEDLQVPLKSNCDKLKTIVFHEKLGSVYDKVGRVEKLSAFIAEKLSYNAVELSQTAETSALCKADLVTKAVYEFTELQGIMGEYYALAEGRAKEVARGIKEHYMPCFAGDKLPETACGTAVALADKLDSLCCFFAMDMIPSGSQDPYALRRAATGVVRIIIENNLPLKLRECFDYAFKLIKQDVPSLSFDAAAAGEQLLAFMKQRLDKSLQEENISYDVINAVFAVGGDELCDIRIKALAISEFRKESGFALLLAGFKRAANLLKNAEAKNEIIAGNMLPFSENMLKDTAEKNLYNALVAVKGEADGLIAAGEYQKALEKAGTLRESIDSFFNDIMVMTEDKALMLNRLSLLQQITELTAAVGELSRLVD